ncbi:hypothetical protein SODALDRAFT_252097, partial [Sodiomyces alkalinus F11]
NASKKSDGALSVSRPSPQPGGTGISDLLEPAVDGPPSPERIRALNKQMKRASLWDSQGSPLTRSPAPDRPSWEHSHEHNTLSRHSSGRSTSSSMPSRERPESVQLFGKTIFNRGTRLKRESSANSSSGSSLYSTDRSIDGTAPPAKEYVPGLFGRKKVQQKGDASLDRLPSDNGNKKLQISGPFNFHHVTQPRRDRVPHPERGHRAEPASDWPAIRGAQSPTGASTRGIETGDAFHHSNLSSEDFAFQQDAAFVDSSTSAPHRTPPSPVDPAPPVSRAPIPPPRLSSRASLRYDGVEPLDRTPPGRPQTSGGFYPPESFGPPSSGMDTYPDLHDDVDQFQGYGISPSPHFSHALTTPDDAAWPLKTNTAFAYETPLPNVPEEDENHGAGRRSQMSLASNNSSLRGSHSVPMLRQVAQLQSNGPQRPPSGASDTLGPLERTVAHSGASNPRGRNTDAGISVYRESWEDDIDYCYEHEAEADFEYAWDRPSLEINRETDFIPSTNKEDRAGKEGKDDKEDDWGADAATSPQGPRGGEPQSFGLKPVPARHLNISVLGPVEDSVADVVSVTKPTATQDFKESHGFTLSPSLLIPGDYQEQMVMPELKVDKLPDESIARIENDFPYVGEPPITLSTSGLYINERHSTSTTGSNSTGRTSASEERHVSAHSDSTAFTRYTASTIFESWNPKALDAPEPVPSVQLESFSDLPSPKRAKAPTSPKSETEYATTQLFPGDERDEDEYSDVRGVHGGLHGSVLDNDQLPTIKEAFKQPSRQKGHTNNPSVSGRGYALFPPAYIGNRI